MVGLVGRSPADPEPRDTAMAEPSKEAADYAAKGRSTLEKVAEHFNLPIAALCRKAGIKANAVHNYLTGRSDSLNNNTTLIPLAKSVGLTVSHLLGEVPLPWEPEEVPRSRKLNKPIQVSVKSDDFELTLLVNLNYGQVMEMVRAILNAEERNNDCRKDGT
jgi:hypothetical protein